MAKDTKIEWADSTANFWIGCTKDGVGCVNCYAEADWDKRKHRVQWGPRGARSYCAAGWSLIPKLGRPAMANSGIDPLLGRRRRIFINSLSDSFDDHPSIIWRDDMFGLLDHWPCMDMLVLTKRIENVATMAPRDWTHEMGQWPEHIWLGISVPSQAEVAKDIPELVRLKVTHRISRIFLSIEPLVERVYISDELMRHIDWVIVGGESGRHARPMHPDWARELRDQCVRLGIPFLFKQWGEWKEGEGEFALENALLTYVPADGSWGKTSRADARGYAMHRAGKKHAGRLLDGVQHDGMPV